MTAMSDETATSPIDRVRSLLDGVRQNGAGWMARCPAHEDREASLSLTLGDDGRVLVHCFAGCSAEEIVGALGMEMRDLFPENGRRPQENARPNGRSRLTVADLAQDKKLPEPFLRELGVVENGSSVRITYKLADGSEAPRQRIRTALSGNKGSCWAKGKGEVVPYGLWRLEDARSLGNLVLVEGESDCWTLWFHGFQALGIPGAKMVNKLQAPHLEGIERLFVFREPDDGGQAFVAGIARRLKTLGWGGDARVIELPDAKDANDLHKQFLAGGKDSPDSPDSPSEKFAEAWTTAMESSLPLPEPTTNGERWKQRRQPPAAGAIEDARPEIEVRDDDLVVLLDEAWGALATWNAAHPRVFRFAGMASSVRVDEHGEPEIRPLKPNAMRELMAGVARWFRVKLVNAVDEDTAEEVKRARRDAVKPPSDLIHIMLDTPRDCLPGLNRIIHAPLVAASGRIVLGEGYDPATRTYHVPGDLVVPTVSEQPTAEEVQAAVRLFTEELLGDFPFVDDADRANALALFLLPFAREIISDNPTPLHLIEKPTPGTGADLMVEALGTMLRGRAPAFMAEGRDEDEWRKRITSTLMDGQEIVCIDNVRRRLESASLSIALTCRVWADRLLGTSDNVRLRVRCIWIATGNNPGVSSEIARRAAPIRIDAKMDRPWERKSSRHPDLLLWIKGQRGRLIHAALTLVRAWIVAERPAGVASLGSYEPWAAVMGGILKVAGVKKFLENRARFYDRADRETAAWRAFIEAWWEKFEGEKVGVKDLFGLLEEVEPPCDLGRGSEQAQKIRLGDALKGALDRRFNIGGMMVKVENAGKLKQATRYQLSSEGESGESFPPGVNCDSAEKK